jgi:hypothetical protein
LTYESWICPDDAASDECDDVGQRDAMTMITMFQEIREPTGAEIRMGGVYECPSDFDGV